MSQMRWYYDANGVADGPHDEAAMFAAKLDNRIQADTLVWHRDMETWQEAAAINPRWWHEEAMATEVPLVPIRHVESKPPAAPVEVESEARRRPVPKAPTGGAGRGSFLQKLFGRNSKK